MSERPFNLFPILYEFLALEKPHTYIDYETSLFNNKKRHVDYG